MSADYPLRAQKNLRVTPPAKGYGQAFQELSASAQELVFVRRFGLTAIF